MSNLTQKDMSILTQVAFKEATRAGDDVLDDTGAAAFEQRFSYYQQSLVAAVEAAMGSVATVIPSPQGADVNAAQALANAGMTGVTVKGDQHGPLPDWAIQAALAAGVTELFDNRDRAQNNPRYPWFKSTVKLPDGKGGLDYKPFWPPKS